MMTSRNRDAVAFLHALNSEDAPHLLFFSPTKYPLSPKCQKVFCSPILSPFILIPLSAFEPPGFLPLQHRNPFHHHGNHTSHYFSCTHEASSLPSVFSLLYHQESIWIRGGLQGTQTKAQNRTTTLPKTNLELMGLSHVGFGSQNYQNQCFTSADLMNRLNRMSTRRTGCKNFWKFDIKFLKE